VPILHDARLMAEWTQVAAPWQRAKRHRQKSAEDGGIPVATRGVARVAVCAGNAHDAAGVGQEAAEGGGVDATVIACRFNGQGDEGPDQAGMRLFCSIAGISFETLKSILGRTHATAAGSFEVLGPIEPMSRGKLNWLITIPADGSLTLDGVAPALIQWDAEPHPAAK
jgi:hypothetical protein